MLSRLPYRRLPVRLRRGCLGCLGSLVWQLAMLSSWAGILVIASISILAPWAFYLGGKFHILPYWQGWGKAHAKSGDYLLYVQIEPTSRGSGMHLETNLTGTAYVCTPGERTFACIWEAVSEST